MVFKNYSRKREPSFNANAVKKMKQAVGSAMKWRYYKQQAKPGKAGNTSAVADTKYFNCTGNLESTFAMSPAQPVVHLSPIMQGDTVNNRTGRSCRGTSLRIRGRLQPGSSGTGVTQNYWAIVYDNSCRQALPLATDIFDSGSYAPFPKRENADRFKILRYWQEYVDVTNDYPGGHSIDEYIKLPDNCVFNWTTADTTGVIDNCVGGA